MDRVDQNLEGDTSGRQQGHKFIEGCLAAVFCVAILLCACAYAAFRLIGFVKYVYADTRVASRRFITQGDKDVWAKVSKARALIYYCVVESFRNLLP